MEDLPSTDTLKVAVVYDRHERTAAELAASKHGPLLRRPLVLYPAAIVGGLLIYWVPTLFRHLLHPAVPAVARVLVSVAVMVAAAFSIKRTVRLKEEAERHETHPDVYTLDDAGLEISGVDDLALMSWSSMTRVHETDRFFLFVAGPEVQYLPKRVLDPAQVDSVRALIARHAPAAGRRLPAPPGN